MFQMTEINFEAHHWVLLYLFIGALIMSFGLGRDRTVGMKPFTKFIFSILIWLGWGPLMVFGIILLIRERIK